MSKVGTVALIVKESEAGPTLVEALSDLEEISVLEKQILEGGINPLQEVYDLRSKHDKEDEEFGDYIEEILCQPFVKEELREQGVRWFKSKIKIEEFQRCERDATRVIAGYAYKLFQDNPKRKDFLLASEHAKVRILVFELPKMKEATSSDTGTGQVPPSQVA